MKRHETVATMESVTSLSALGGGLAASGVPALLAGADDKILWANEAALELAAAGATGAHGGPAELTGSRVADHVSRVEEKATSIIVTPRLWPGRFFRRLDVPCGNDGTSLVLLLECTEEILQDRASREREVYLSRAAEDSMDAIVSLDTLGRIRYWNHGAERMFGYTAGEVLDQPYEMLVPEEMKKEGELDRIVEILDRQGVLRNFETVRVARGGRFVEVDLTVTRLRDEEGTILGRSVIYRDISMRHRLEAEVQENLQRLEALKLELSLRVGQLRQANVTLRRNQRRLIAMEKLSAIGEMAARLAHEVRTPLVTIGGFSHTLTRTMPAEDPRRRYVEIIREEVKRLENIVSEILDYVKPGEIATEECDANTMVEEALKTHVETMQAAGIALTRELAGELPSVVANRYQIHQVLTNLIMNAIQAMQTASSASRLLKVATGPGENHVWISVADTGPGIPERHRDRVFKPFFTTKPAGSGLGLAISAQIVTQHRATLTFESQEGTGTTFHLRLPIRREEPGDEDDPRGG
jgi:PAS domain S-box-containing protein